MSRLGTIYLAGPMRGYPEHNFPAFNAAEERLAAAGWNVRSPVKIGAALFDNDPNTPGGQYLRADLREITFCDAMALLPGWERSTGARCEVAAAITIGLQFLDAETGQAIDAPKRVTISGGYERPAGPIDTLDALADEACAWANATFTQAKASSKAEHLRREAEELCKAPRDVEEMADIFILLSHACDGLDLRTAVRAKLEKNKLRKWGKPDADGVVEHVAEGVA